ncbi:ParB/RepB/Spo0J family partition protein [Microbispora triticiradicis]|uniref:ParB/RepB/Spo0J family partition protein n=1 Tax=Microbispora triticiradicis TaxID=2200763 RepID=UPI001AD73EC2|nr:ParB/RepB/Spo0J family partition protein [Microbispora triticiradicis]MBO4269943.1 ParB N-terminal domain-containing protein [Microbispora triticiradicis]
MPKSRFQYELPDHRVEYGVEVDIDSLKIDEDAQRGLNQKRAKGIADGLIVDALGSIVVSERADGDRYVVDGMHRTEACRLRGLRTIKAEIHYGLTQQQEATLFLIKNRESAKVSTLDEYKVGLTAGDALCVNVDRVLTSHDLKLGSSSTNSVGAVSAVLRITKQYGPEVLDRTLQVVQAAWGRNKESWDGVILGGVAMFLSRHGAGIDDEDLAKRLLKRGMAARWRSEALTRASNGGYNNSGTGSRESQCYQMVVESWNKGRSANNRVG